jgi:hypothetical protein
MEGQNHIDDSRMEIVKFPIFYDLGKFQGFMLSNQRDKGPWVHTFGENFFAEICDQIAGEYHFFLEMADIELDPMVW